ncbi:phage portal protein [Bartonella sp. DGB2]|uniref:phage portal protein n=1 Tax=Bartonella sp. DGB2 TaxID=3388426 RepID=UPI00398FE65C
MAGIIKRMANAFQVMVGSGPYFDAASRSRRLRGFIPTKTHINRAIQAEGQTVLARSRSLYDNNSIYGAAVDEWVSAAVNDGIKPVPRIKGFEAQKRALENLWWQWVDEADYEGVSDFYGMQATIAREVFLAGEVFVRLRPVPLDACSAVPLKLEIYPAELLDVTYDGPAEIPGHHIRMGIEFNAFGDRIAYHFFRYHPYDIVPNGRLAEGMQERVRIEAPYIIHIKERRQAQQLRGTPKITRSMVQLFQLAAYDDAELDRKKTTALFTAFILGGESNPLTPDVQAERTMNTASLAGGEGDTIELAPGLVTVLENGQDIRFSAPAEVGGSYEPFQYRNLLKICAGLNMPYSTVSGDVTRGNFSNVRTSIIQFRRHIRQWRANVMAFQLNRIVWKRFVEMAVLVGAIDLPDYDHNPLPWLQSESHAAQLEMVDPLKDIAAEKEEIRAGLKSLTQALNERGYSRDDIYTEIEEERSEALRRGLHFDTETPAPHNRPA